MNKEAQYKNLFHLTSIVTDFSPVAGARVLDVFFKNLLGNKLLVKSFSLQSQRKIERVKKFSRFLVVADLNIGDAIICSSGVAALRKIFPRAEINFVIKKSTGGFFVGNPDITNLFPVYNGAQYPTEEDISQISKIASSKDYDLIINFSPMISDKIFGRQNVVNFSLMAAQLIRNEKFEEKVNNVSYQAFNFIKDLFRDYLPSEFDDKFDGPSVYLPEAAVDIANNFLLKNNISNDLPVIFLNPDASAKYTRIPFEVQLDLLQNLTELNCAVLLGGGHVEKNIEQKLLQSLPVKNRNKVVIVPAEFKLDAYAALIDFADVYITGDTGPLHIAAARKFLRNNGSSLRNKTAIFSIFGGTPSHIYGFDSKKPGYFAANQDAPSRAFIAPSPCRNITCINKLAKTCGTVRCFNSLNINEIIVESANHLETARLYRSVNNKNVS